MGRKMIQVESLYGVTTEQLKSIADNYESNYTKDCIQAIIQRFNGISTSIISKKLNKCITTIVSYINNWNKWGIISVFDNRGDNIVPIINEAIGEDIRDIVLNKLPEDFNYEQGAWTAATIKQYVEEKYNKHCCETTIIDALKKLGFSHKRGECKPTHGNEVEREEFKKNERTVG